MQHKRSKEQSHATAKEEQQRATFRHSPVQINPQQHPCGESALRSWLLRYEYACMYG